MEKSARVFIGAFAMGLVLVASSVATVPVRAATGVVAEAGGTELFGGGDYRFIRFGNDAAFGVVWGNATNPNNIYLVAIKARYLGVVNVRSSDGTTIVDDGPVRVHTLYAFKLGALIEFDDLNSDGIASYTRVVSNDNYTGYVQTEPLGKMVSLNTSWDASAVTHTTPSEGVNTWAFNLTARNQSYIPIAGSASGVLDEMTFTFHLETRVVHVDNMTVPHYAVTVERSGGRWTVTNGTRDGDITWSGDRLRYNAKWDQRIVGWDFDPLNSRPGLVLEMGAIVANRIPADLSEWFGAAVLREMGEEGRLAWRDESGTANASSDTTYPTPRRLVDRSVTAGGEWSQIGRLTWVADCTVDGNPGSVYAQVQGGIVGITRTREGTYFGFVLLVGLSFPGGQTIEHDPAMDTEAFIITSAGLLGNIGGLLVAMVAVLLVVLVVVLIAVRRRRKPQQPGGAPPKDPFDPQNP